MPKKLTQEEYQNKVNSLFNNVFTDFDTFSGSDHPMKMTCSTHNEVCTTTQARSFYAQPNPCSFCRQEKGDRTIVKHSLQSFKNLLEKTHTNTVWDFTDSVYRGKKEDLSIRCTIHGLITKTPDSFIRFGCTSCYLEEGKRSSRRFTKEFFISELNRLHPDSFNTVNLKWTSVTEDTEFVCNKHGSFITKPIHLLEVGCKLCKEEKGIKTSNIPLTKQKLLDNLRASIPNTIFDNLTFDKVPETFKSTDLLEISCKLHGDLSKPYSYLKEATILCRECAKDNNLFAWNNETFIKRIEEMWPGLYTFEKTEYKSAHDPVTITCIKHNYDVTKTALNFSNHKVGCTRCSPMSKGEEELCQFLDSLNISYSKSRPSWLNGKEIDILIEEYKIAIEYNGSAYHHSSKNTSNNFINKMYKPSSYHYDKWKACKDNGYRLISIYDFKWKDAVKREVYKSLIKHCLQLDERIYARKTTLKSIENKVAKQFCQENHLEGFSTPLYKDSKSYGLFYNEKLVMTSTIGFLYDQSSKQHKLKLQRICTLKGYTVVGGISKLSKYLKKTHGSFIYQTTNDTGSILDGTSSPKSCRYFWVNLKDLSYHSRNYCQKHLLESNFKTDLKLNETETEYMERLGYVKVYDSGLTTLHEN